MDPRVSPGDRKCKPKRKLSRFGCRNCKLRKLKCDETRPHCSKCQAYGICCNFGFNIPDLQPIHQKQTKKETSSLVVIPRPRPTISNAIWVSDGSTYFTLDLEDQKLFNRFHNQVLDSLDGPVLVHIWENHMLQLCFSYPFLMHGTLAMAAAHERYFEKTPTHRRSFRESYHAAQLTTLLNKQLSRPIREEYKDPLWAAAGAVGILTYCALTASSLDNVWPLRAPDASDIDWLRLGSGKMKLWHLVNPMRPGSVYRVIYEKIGLHTSVPITPGTNGVSAELVQLCGLDESSTQENNPFFAVAHGLSPLLEAPKGRATLGSAMRVWGLMDSRFVGLLEMKDPVALLLLCLWYSRASECRWWIRARARFELPALCTYLERYHKDNTVVQALIPSLNV